MAYVTANDLLITRGSGLIEAEIDGEMVALHVDRGTCYGFNQTAYQVWQLIESPTTLDKVCATLAQRFAVDPATCEIDVRAVLDDLAKDQLITLGFR